MIKIIVNVRVVHTRQENVHTQHQKNVYTHQQNVYPNVSIIADAKDVLTKFIILNLQNFMMKMVN
jgi:hypothetical protein